MEKITNLIHIDLNSPVYKIIKANQYENCSRIIIVSLNNNGEKYTIPEGILVQFEGHKANGASFVKKCDYYDNTITIVLDSDILYHAGTCKAKIVMYDLNNEIILSTPLLEISVSKSPCEKDNISEDDKTLIEQLNINMETHICDNNIHISETEHERYNYLSNDVISNKKPLNQKNGDFWTKIL